VFKCDITVNMAFVNKGRHCPEIIVQNVQTLQATADHHVPRFYTVRRSSA